MCIIIFGHVICIDNAMIVAFLAGVMPIIYGIKRYLGAKSGKSGDNSGGGDE